MPRYADIILPLSFESFTYQVDEPLELEVGCAVVVPLGQGGEKFYTGIVWRLHDQAPPYKNIKRVVRRLYSAPLLSSEQQRFWEWVASYYMCNLGSVMRVALPSMMKPSGQSDEQLAREQYTPRTEYYVALTAASEAQLSEQMESVERRAPRQFAALGELYELGEGLSQRIPRRLLASDIATLRAIARKGWITLEQGEVTLEKPLKRLFTLPQLSDHQCEALSKIESDFQSKAAVLLHGITGSGKTEIYIHLIAKELEQGNDVLLLLPEIALTAQLLERMERIFGSRVVAYHSKLSPRRRTEIFLQINSSEGGNFVVGVRSSIFLPLKQLNLIIVDEEHDSSYKQSDSAPRYNARDAAVAIASMRGGKVLLGSATPSLESWTNAQCGKYGIAHLRERYGDALPPQIIISDTVRAAKRGERKGHFNFLLLDKIRERVERGEQSILFQNRRGFAPYVECSECGWTPRCPHCNVSLTLHKSQGRLSCHYCGYTEPAKEQCPHCNNLSLRPMGFGTEKIEEQIGSLVEGAAVGRLDRDTVSSPRALGQIIDDFEQGRTNILVGTQMITKGFDFSRVTLSAILNADNMLNTPDFRAEERAFGLMMQVAGRAGRRSEVGEVVIQTSQPDHRILQFVAQNDYESMARTLLSEREAFGYPPYSRIIDITLRYKDLNRLNAAANHLATALRAIFGRRLQGPSTPPLDKIRDEHIVNLKLKIESGASSARARALLQEQLDEMAKVQEFRYITIVCNVDPQ